MNDKLKTRLSKLFALANRGVGGEKVNAERMLRKMLIRHDLDFSDILDDEKEDVWFKYGRYAVYRKLLNQIIVTVCGEKTSVFVIKSKRYQLCVECTKTQKIEIDLRFEIYKKALKDHLDLSYSAFIHANNIFPDTDDDHEEQEELTSKEMDRLDKLMNMMAGITPTVVNKAIDCRP